jgi:hypothetical protein
MKSGQPNKIRSMPPSMRSPEQAMADLDKLQEWTEQPAKDAASAIAPKIEDVAAVAAQSPPAARYPWEDAPGAVEAVKLVNFKIPIKLYLKLKYLGDTTYGSSMTQIFVTAMEKETDRLLKERGG